MPDYKNMPKQRGESDNPQYVTDPRKYAKARCIRAEGACDKVIEYMGALVQTYMPAEMLPAEAVKEGLELAHFALANGISMDLLIDQTYQQQLNPGGLGEMAGYIAVAALIMEQAELLRETIASLKSTI